MPVGDDTIPQATGQLLAGLSCWAGATGPSSLPVHILDHHTHWRRP